MLEVFYFIALDAHLQISKLIMVAKFIFKGKK